MMDILIPELGSASSHIKPVAQPKTRSVTSIKGSLALAMFAGASIRSLNLCQGWDALERPDHHAEI
jgi:hypothetical protein